MLKPKVIFFDAGGTLFEVRGSVGEIYQQCAERHGLPADASTLQHSFRPAFQQQPPLAFPAGLTWPELEQRERAWWRKLVADVFGEASHHTAFDHFFDDVYEAFRHADAWEIFADVRPALVALSERGIRLSVISNFDSRLDQIMRVTGLADYFDAVYISTRCGAAKPDARIFEHALREQGISADEAWHIGDAWREDVEGARQVGLRPFWLRRETSSVEPERQLVHLASLNDLPLVAA